jgi:hypothetical protein
MVMRKQQPGVKTFLSFLVLIGVFILISVFLDRVENLEKKVERVAVSKQVNEINSLLVMIMLEHRINNRINDLADSHLGNPFELFESQASGLNYVANPGEKQRSAEGFWYFDRSTSETIYRSAVDATLYRYRLEFEYDDLNQSGRFERGIDQPRLLTLLK